MAEIRPFRGIRYDTDRVGGLREVVGPPEDIPSPQRAADLVAGHPYHAVRLEVADPGRRPKHFRQAASCFRDWLREGILTRAAIPALYVHQHEFSYAGRRLRRRGFFAALRLSDYDERIILPHENTLPGNVELRAELLRDVQANLSSVYLLAQDHGKLEATLDQIASTPADISGIDGEGGVHHLWTVTNPAQVRALRDAVAPGPLFIADGHHRYVAALTYQSELRAGGHEPGQADWTLAYIADASDRGILVLPIHRVVRSIGERTWVSVRDSLEAYFTIEEIPLPSAVPDQAVHFAVQELAERQGEPTYLLAAPGGDHLLSLRLRDWSAVEGLIPGESGRVASRLDVTVLDSVVLRHVLGITDQEIERLVEFTPDSLSAYESVRSSESALAVLMRPTPLTSLLAVARAGGRMPQKSTYFYPKIPIGLMMRDLRDIEEETG